MRHFRGSYFLSNCLLSNSVYKLKTPSLFFILGTYVTLALLNKEDEVLEKKKSKTKKGTLTPEYDTEVKFLVPDNLLPEVKLLIKLKKKTLLKPPTTIGKSLLQPTSDHLVQLNEKEYTEGWFSVFTKPKNN